MPLTQFQMQRIYLVLLRAKTREELRARAFLIMLAVDTNDDVPVVKKKIWDEVKREKGWDLNAQNQ